MKTIINLIFYLATYFALSAIYGNNLFLWPEPVVAWFAAVPVALIVYKMMTHVEKSDIVDLERSDWLKRVAENAAICAERDRKHRAQWEARIRFKNSLPILTNEELRAHLRANGCDDIEAVKREALARLLK